MSVQKRKGLIERYREFLPSVQSSVPVSLGEGSTPLQYAPFLSQITNCAVYIKVEGANPTGSFKDRGMTLAMTVARDEGRKAVLCASTGNTSASAAAYAAAAGLQSVVLIPEGKIAQGKLSQAIMHGTKIIQVQGNFDDCLELAQKAASNNPYFCLVNSVNPVRLEGQKTAAFEIIEDLDFAPDLHFLPVGNAGNISAYWMGYKEFYELGKSDIRPRMVGVQAAGAAPFVLGHPVRNPETLATAIRIGSPASWNKALEAQQSSHGWFIARTDEEILEAYRLLAEKEGIFVEPASAASVAGLLSASASGDLQEAKTVVCTVTGHGLKDPQTALLSMPEIVSIAPEPQLLFDQLSTS